MSIARVVLLAAFAVPTAPPLPDAAVRRFGGDAWHHGGPISSAALSSDGTLLATAGRRSVRVWNLVTGQVQHSFRCENGPTFACPGLCFSPDGKRLGYVRGPEFACVWDVATGREVKRWTGAHGRSVAGFSADGRLFCFAQDRRLRFWDLDADRESWSVAAAESTSARRT